MRLADVNVLVYAHASRAPRHEEYAQWLVDHVSADEAYAQSDLILSSFVRVVTNPRIFTPAMELRDALAAAHDIRTRPNCVLIAPGRRHWSIFTRLALEAEAKGNLVTDAYLAALAIEAGCDLVSADRDFARFPALRWRHPLE